MNTRDDQLDLEWFYNDATGDLSQPSSFGAMVARLQMGKQAKAYASSESAENQIEKQLDAAKRYGEIEEALSTLSMARQKLLEDAFEQTRCPVEVVARPRHLYKAARASEAMREHLRSIGEPTWTARVADEWLARAEYPHAHAGYNAAQLEALRDACWAQALETVNKAVDAYGRARIDGKRQVEAERRARFVKLMAGVRL